METNPVLAELQNLSPTAKATLIQAHTAANPMQGTQAPQLANLRQPPEQAPPSLQAPSQMQPVPQLGMQQPNITLGKQPKGTLIGDQQALQEMEGKKSPLESVYGKITRSEFGQNHPKLGKLLGVLGQIPATAVDIAASSALPRIGALIPGTSINRGLELRGLENRIGQEESNQQKEAQTREANARVPLEHAQAEALQHPKPQILQTEGGFASVVPGETTATPITGPQGKQVQPFEKTHNRTAEEQAFSSLIEQGIKPLDALKSINEARDKGALHYETVTGPDHKPHTYGLDAKGNRVVDVWESIMRSPLLLLP